MTPKLQLVLLLSFVLSTAALFGDYADGTFECPAVTTCPRVCVRELIDCPSQLVCGAGESLCPDGHCVNLSRGEHCDSRNGNPCGSNKCDFNVACPTIVMQYPSCYDEFDFYYDEATACPAETEDPPTLSWTSPGHLFFYIWIGSVTFLVWLWCFINHKAAPKGETVPLQEHHSRKRKSSYPSLEERSAKKASPTKMGMATITQTAFCKTILGKFLYVLVLATLLGFQVLLACTVAFFYAQMEGRYGVNPFENQKQALATFEVVWIIGFGWHLCMKWPPSVEYLFWRRCEMNKANIILVNAPSLEAPEQDKKNCLSKVSKLMTHLYRGLDLVMGFIFSDSNKRGHRTVTVCPVTLTEDGHRFITFRMRRYNYDDHVHCFVPGHWSVGTTVKDFCCCSEGLSSVEAQKRHRAIGMNIVPVSKPSIASITINEFNKIFYVYQNYILWPWFNFNYWPLGVILTILIIVGGLTMSFLKYRHDLNLYRLSKTSGTIETLRDQEWKTLPQKELAPGDVINLAPGIVHCDMVLIDTDTTVLVDESALTGEATPVAKVALDSSAQDSIYHPKQEHRKSTVVAGARILEAPSSATAVVTQIGTFSAKGELLRDIFHIERHRFKFDVQMELVLTILLVMAIVNFVILTQLLGESDFVYAFYWGIFVVYASIPALLPTVFAASMALSSNRLFEKRIACSNSRDIFVAGKVRMAFFDKTGTLTAQGLEFLSSTGDDVIMSRGMAVCHTLTKTSSGTIIGHFIDQVMFQASHAVMDHIDGAAFSVTTHDESVVKVVKRFEFDHHLMTQSVLVKDEEKGTLSIFVKGSAESMKKRCRADTLPPDFDEIVKKSAKDGIYQISLAVREIPELVNVGTTKRDDLENDLTFVGFMNFKNVLREETPEVLETLKNGDVHSKILTGDSVYTGVCIARESGLIDPNATVLIGISVDAPTGNVNWIDNDTDKEEKLPSLDELSDSSRFALAITGEVWDHMSANSKELAQRLAPFIQVYGRCTPNGKVSVVSFFVESGYVTLMCGDGGNDCGALKVAHVGIALSDAEASIVSSFTSLNKSVSSVVDLLKEGRCGLANALASYKYMLMYGQIKVLMNFVLAYFSVNFYIWNWFFLDGFWMPTMAFTIPLPKAAKTLAPERPTASLFGWHTMSSFMGMLIINFLFLVIALAALNHQDWYECRKWTSNDITNLLVLGDNYEAQVTWLVCGFTYIHSAFAFNYGFAHRAAWYRNYLLVAFAVGWTALHFTVTLYPSKVSCIFRVNCVNEDVVRGVFEAAPVSIQNAFNATVMPLYFRRILVVIMAANAISTSAWEQLVNRGFKRVAKRSKFAKQEKPREQQNSQLKKTAPLEV